MRKVRINVASSRQTKKDGNEEVSSESDGGVDS